MNPFRTAISFPKEELIKDAKYFAQITAKINSLKADLPARPLDQKRIKKFIAAAFKQIEKKARKGGNQIYFSGTFFSEISKEEAKEIASYFKVLKFYTDALNISPSDEDPFVVIKWVK